MYIPDPGDGSGIAIALTQPNGPGDVGIRPGTYNLTGGPLTVPNNVKVVGAGLTTRIVGAATGNQGAWVLGFNSQLRDMDVAVNASDAGSVVSTAVIRSIGAALIENVTVTFATDPGGVLRHGISFEPGVPGPIGGQITTIRDVIVQATTTTGIVSPTVCYLVQTIQQDQAFVHGDQVVAIGGDVSVVNDGIFVLVLFLAIGWSQYGVFVPNGSGAGTFRCDESLVQVGTPAANPIGIYLQAGGGHLMRAMTVQVPVQGSRGIVVDDPNGGGSGGLMIDDCFVFADVEGIRLGSATFGIGDATVRDTNVQSGGKSIVIGPNSDAMQVRGNVINTGGGAFAPPDVGIESAAGRTAIAQNVINVSDSAGTAHGIRSIGSRSTIVGNMVNVQGAEGIHVEGERTTITGNEIEAQGQQSAWIGIHVLAAAIRCTCGDNNVTNTNPFLLSPIVIDANFCSVGDNTTFVISGNTPTPGIAIFGNNNTCVGNVCEGSPPPGGAVAVTGLNNEVAHNVGA
jgi:hypothetical protein